MCKMKTGVASLIALALLALKVELGQCAGGEFRDAAIAVDSKPCAQIGM